MKKEFIEDIQGFKKDVLSLNFFEKEKIVFNHYRNQQKITNFINKLNLFNQKIEKLTGPSREKEIHSLIISSFELEECIYQLIIFLNKFLNQKKLPIIPGYSKFDWLIIDELIKNVKFCFCQEVDKNNKLVLINVKKNRNICIIKNIDENNTAKINRGMYIDKFKESPINKKRKNLNADSEENTNKG